MRIGYLYNLKINPPRGGNHVHAFELTRGFLERGHSVSVIDDSTMPGVVNYPSTSYGLKNFVDDIDILYVRIDARFTRQWKYLHTCMSEAGSKPTIWEINAPSNEALAFSWLGGRAWKGEGSRESPLRLFRRGIHAARNTPGILLEERHRRKLARRVTSAICVSTALKRYAVEELGIGDVLVLPNGGPLLSEEDIRRRNAKNKAGGFTVLYSGSSTYPWQGIECLCGVISIAEQKAPDLKFVLAVNQRSPNLPNSSNVIIREALDRDEILDAICAADACVCLHPEYFWSKYGFHNSPMKLFEYMACMRPIVTSRHGQMSQIIQHGVNGLLCDNFPQEVLLNLLLLRDNPNQAERLGRKAWLSIQSEYNWPRNVLLTLELFARQLGALK